MKPSLLGALLLLVGVVDLAVGLFIVAPRAKPQVQTTLKFAFLASFTILWAVGGAIAAGWIPIQ